MKLFRNVFSFVVILSFLGSSQVVDAQDDFSYSFTSGAWGDGFEWPRSQRGNRTSSGAIAGDPFFTPDNVVFYNFSGNLAFFDGNNLLTRPSNLINGDAWWTDPKTITGFSSFGPFQTAFWLIDFFNAGGIEESFGFDLAIASVSAPVDPNILSTISTIDGFNVFAILDLTGNSTFGSQPDFTVEAGEFFTLSSPHPGREARFFFDITDLQNWIYDEAESSEDFSGFYTDPSEIRIESLDLRLIDFATPGGTTQVALDNFVFANASAPIPLKEPRLLPPLPEIGENTPQYINYAASPEDLPGESADLRGSDFGADLNEVKSEVDMSEYEDLGADAATMGTSIVFESNTVGTGTGDLAAHEVTHALQQPGGGGGGGDEVGGDSFAVGGLSEPPLPLGMTVTVNNLLQDGAGGLESEGTTSDLQIIQLTGSTINNVQANPSLHEQAGAPREMFNDPSEPGTAAVQLVPDINIIILGGVSGSFLPGGEYFYNYSATDYVLLKEAQGDPLVEGDGGSIVTPIINEAGQIIDYQFSAWIVTDDSGTYRAEIVNPVPPTPFQVWSDAEELIYVYTGSPSFFFTPTTTGRKTGAHFAMDSDPLGNGSPRANWKIDFLTDGGAEEYYTVTLPVRVGATFSGTPLTSAPLDGITYTIRADDDLAGSDLTVVERSTVADITGLPVPGDLDGIPGPDWEYRSFRLTSPRNVISNAYFWVEVAEE